MSLYVFGHVTSYCVNLIIMKLNRNEGKEGAWGSRGPFDRKVKAFISLANLATLPI